MSGFWHLLVCAFVLSTSSTIQPDEAARLISAANQPRPNIIYVGFPSLYNGAHITGAISAGPASKPEGIEQLKQVVENPLELLL